MHQREGNPPKRLALVGVLRASVSQLVPGQGQVMRSWGTMRSDLRQVFALRVALGQIATVRGRRRRRAALCTSSTKRRTRALFFSADMQ
jgi:hypothetical protein